MHEIKAQTDCIISSLSKNNGDTVKAGDEIIITEVMKMMIPVATPVDGTIKYKVAKYDYVYAGMVMAEIE